MEKTINECISNIQQFADTHNIKFEQDGEVGFGRECVGLMKGSNYIDYCPINMETYGDLPELYDERLLKIAPNNAYHKHDCLAVLGRDEEAIRQLSDWVDKLKELNVSIEEYSTGATGLQAMISGSKGYAVKVNK